MVNSPEFYKLYRKVYLQYKELYGEKVCVFLLKGHFWEFYGQQDPDTQLYEDTVKEITDLLGVKLTVYPNGAPDNKHGLFAGVPISTLDKWGGRLTSLGWTVIVMEEVRDAKGAVLRREVTKILSPGTHVENAEASESFFLGSLWLTTKNTDPPEFGAAVADLTTGQVILYEGKTTGRIESWYADDLRHFFQVYRPRELIVSWNGPQVFEPSEDIYRGFTFSSKSPIHSITSKTTQFSREEYMRTLFQPKTSLPIRTWLCLEPDSYSELALYNLLQFSEDHAPSLAKSLQKPHVWHPSTHLRIVNNALQQLNFVTQDEHQSIISLFTSPITAMGKRAISERLCIPLADPIQISKRLEQVQYFIDTETSSKNIQACFQSMYDLPRLNRLIIKGKVGPSEVLQLIQTLISAEHLYEFVKDSPIESTFDSVSIIDAVKECLAVLESIFDKQRAAAALENPDDYGCLHEHIGPKTAAYEKKCADVYKSANDWLSKLSRLTNIPMQYKPQEKFAFLVQITKTQSKQINISNLKISDYKNISIKTMTSNARIEDSALEGFQSMLDSSQQGLKRAFADEVCAACIQYIEKTRHLWASIETWITDLDCTVSISKTAVARGFTKPTILNDVGPSGIRCSQLRHPLIEAQKTRSKLVPHDIAIGLDPDQSGWLLYGMNASGKSSLMKAIGIAVLLAQSGSFVPAKSMELRPFQSLATRILNQDNLWAGLSSFAVEISELREIFNICDHQTLVLGDELCSGTESVSATSIVAAGIKYLQKSESRFVLATHLHDLIKFDDIAKNPKLSIWHLRVEYDRITDRLVYHRDLNPGPGTTLYGLEVARALHLPMGILNDAYSFRKQLLGQSIQDTKWNADLKVSNCEICKKKISSLEVHHIQERQHTENGRNADGTAMNDLRNLVAVCSECHDAHHAGKITIGPVIDTSDGQERSIQEEQIQNQIQNQKQNQLSQEDILTIKKVISRNAGLSWKLMRLQIYKEGIDISEKELKALRLKNII